MLLIWQKIENSNHDTIFLFLTCKCYMICFYKHLCTTGMPIQSHAMLSAHNMEQSCHILGESTAIRSIVCRQGFLLSPMVKLELFVF